MMMMMIETSAVGAAAATGDDHPAAIGVGALHNNRPAREREPIPISAINSSAHYTAVIAS